MAKQHKATAKKAATKKEPQEKKVLHFQVRDTTMDHNAEFNTLKAMLQKKYDKKFKSNDALMAIFELAKNNHSQNLHDLQYTKDHFSEVPGIFNNWNDELSDLENISASFLHQSIALRSLQEQIAVKELEIAQLKKQTPGADPLNTIVLSEEEITAFKNADWDETKTLKENVNAQVETVYNTNLAFLKENNNLKLQVIEQNAELETLAARVDEIKSTSVKLTGKQFVCEIEDEVAELALQNRNKLIESGKIISEVPDEYPNELANYAIKKLFTL